MKTNKSFQLDGGNSRIWLHEMTDNQRSKFDSNAWRILCRITAQRFPVAHTSEEQKIGQKDWKKGITFFRADRLRNLKVVSLQYNNAFDDLKVVKIQVGLDQQRFRSKIHAGSNVHELCQYTALLRKRNHPACLDVQRCLGSTELST